MAASSYDEVLRRLLTHEGGYTNDAADPGGPTNFGITITDYRKYVKPGATASDVRAMTVDEAKTIYRAKYWGAQRCDELPAGVDDTVFDYGVNSGIGRSGKVLRRVLGLPDNDWRTSDEVIAACHKLLPSKIINDMNDERLRFLQSLKTWPVFGKGWGRRVAEVKAFSLQLAAGATPQMPEASQDVQRAGKGTVPVAKGAQQGSAGAIIAAGSAAAQQALAHGLDPAVITGLVMLTVILAVVAWRLWQWHQQKEQEKPA
jgi:lysozyme family protein